jgi:hypothetical protein
MVSLNPSTLGFCVACADPSLEQSRYWYWRLEHCPLNDVPIPSFLRSHDDRLTIMIVIREEQR